MGCLLFEDHQVKIIGLGLGLLLTLSVAYEELQNILKESIEQEYGKPLEP